MNLNGRTPATSIPLQYILMKHNRTTLFNLLNMPTHFLHYAYQYVLSISPLHVLK